MRKLNKKKIENAISGSHGVQSIIAKKCGVSRSALTQFLQKQKTNELKNKIEEEKEIVLDIGELELMKLVNEGQFQAIKYLLSTKGKHRGYVERTEVQHSTDEEIKEHLQEWFGTKKEKSSTN